MSVPSDKPQVTLDDKKDAKRISDKVSYAAGILGTILSYWQAIEAGLNAFIIIGILCSLCGFLPLLIRCKNVPVMLAWILTVGVNGIIFFTLLRILTGSIWP